MQIIVLLCGIVPCILFVGVGYSDGDTGGKNGDANGMLAKGTDISGWQDDTVAFI